jgi:hypothetical protein
MDITANLSRMKYILSIMLMIQEIDFDKECMVPFFH